MVKVNGNKSTEMVETKKVPNKRNAADFTSKFETETKCKTDVNKNNLNFSIANEKQNKQKSENFNSKAKTDVDIELGDSPQKPTRDWRPVTFDQLPDWLRDNDFIHAWYRPPLPSIPICLGSVLRIHNETGNIWTHLIGAAAILVAAVQYYFSQGPFLDVFLFVFIL